MAQRDSIIDEKLASLKAGKEKAETELNDLPKFVTNMSFVAPNGNMFNLRAVANIEGLARAFRQLYDLHKNSTAYNEIIKPEVPVNEDVCGYKWEEWVSDVRTMNRKLELTVKIAKYTKAIKDIEKFYSGDRKEENAFNTLLDNIADL